MEKITVVRTGINKAVRAVCIQEADLPQVSLEITADFRQVCRRLAQYKFKVGSEE